MARKIRKYNLKSRITSALRRIWFYGPERRSAAKRAKESGFACELCGDKPVKVQIDHRVPVVGNEGFTNWSEYIDRLFVHESGLQALCDPCHRTKTALAREVRKANKPPSTKTKPKKVKKKA